MEGQPLAHYRGSSSGPRTIMKFGYTVTDRQNHRSGSCPAQLTIVNIVQEEQVITFLVKLESSFTWFRKLRATFHNCGIISGILEAVNVF